MNVNLSKLLTELNDNFDLNDFYCITLWPELNEFSLQGHFTRSNIAVATALGVTLEYKEGFVRGALENEGVKIKITLSSK